jgi:hypothetical protein
MQETPLAAQNQQQQQQDWLLQVAGPASQGQHDQASRRVHQQMLLLLLVVVVVVLLLLLRPSALTSLATVPLPAAADDDDDSAGSAPPAGAQIWAGNSRASAGKVPLAQACLEHLLLPVMLHGLCRTLQPVLLHANFLQCLPTHRLQRDVLWGLLLAPLTVLHLRRCVTQQQLTAAAAAAAAAAGQLLLLPPAPAIARPPSLHSVLHQQQYQLLRRQLRQGRHWLPTSLARLLLLLGLALQLVVLLLPPVLLQQPLDPAYGATRMAAPSLDCHQQARPRHSRAEAG